MAQQIRAIWIYIEWSPSLLMRHVSFIEDAVDEVSSVVLGRGGSTVELDLYAFDTAFPDPYVSHLSP